jgi:hypothetical protein
MSLGGRPKEEEGHKSKRFSLDLKTCKGLEKISSGERSKLIEKALGPVLRQYDPGESCEALGLIDRTLDCEIDSALSKQDYEKATALATLANSLTPFRNLCNLPDEGNSDRNKRKLVSCRRIRNLLE